MGPDVTPATMTHPAVRAARTLRHRRERAITGRLLVEGANAVTEAVAHLSQVFVTATPARRVSDALDHCRAAAVPELVVTERALEALADARTPQGIVGVARRPPATLDDLSDATLVVVLDQVADPGNLGTIIRTADAAGADAVVLTDGSVDPTNAKVVRSSAGSLFHLPVVDGVTVADVVAACRRAGIRLVAADPAATTSCADVSLVEPTAIVCGSEAHGLSATVRVAVDDTISVPMRRSSRPGFTGHAESLNLATTAAIIVYEATRQRERGGADGQR